MISNFENTPSPEQTPDTRVTIEPELLGRIAIYVEMLKYSDISEAQLLLDLGMIDISVESVVKSAVRAYIDGIQGTLHDDPSDA